jgi:glycyl-tRNA synthetase beta chain
MEKNPHNKNLLVELFVEELPPKALNKLGESFANVLFESLKAQGLTLENAAVTAFATPRRLAAHVMYVKDKADDKQVSQKLMPANVGLDANGKATPALIKKLQSLGADESAVTKLKNDNNTLFFDALQTGVSLPDGLQKALDEALGKLPIPKVMTYQLADGWSSVNFVRPAHGLVAMHGSGVVPISTLGLVSGNVTHGHRFEAKVATITIIHADSYAKQLLDEGAVIASFAERRKNIIRQLITKARELDCWLEVEPMHTEGHPMQTLIGYDETEELLSDYQKQPLIQEVTALVERPNVLVGEFEKEFLEVPQECLILTMKANQKYFPLLDSNGKLTNKFLIVSNITPKDPSFVIGGNERVVRPRLADAKFFFDQDRKKTLESRIAGLDKVVYHNKLGSQGERNKRVVKIAENIAEMLVNNNMGDADLVAKVGLAAKLSKTDLVTDMVGEFPELQGIMGRYYAQHEKLDDDVAFAIEDHYKPRFAGDELPRSLVGVCVALADKLETLVGLFSIGEKPTGDKDPFGLRRQALGVIRMLIEVKLPLSFNDLIKTVLTQFNGDAAALQSIQEFSFDRLAVNLKDQGASPQEVDAVLSNSPAMLHEIPARLAAVRTFASLAEAPALAAANKRVTNILKKSEGELTGIVNTSLLQEPAEKALFDVLLKVNPQADKLFESGDYTASLKSLAALKAPVDDFFDNVMVNADDVDLKNNRLNLLKKLHVGMNRVADLSKLAS